MKKNKKKLAKYWIGKRPIDPGYQINKGIGNATFSTQLGQDLSGEARAAKQNILPQTIGKLGGALQYPMEMLKDLSKTSIPAVQAATSAATINTAALSNAAVGGVGARLASGGISDYMGGMFGTTVAKEAGKNAATSAGKGALGAAGTIAGALGTLYGGYNVYNDIANSGPSLSQSDIANSSSVNTYTTDQGNTYTQHGGVDRSSILDYAGSERKSKRLGLTMDTTGLGASLGGLVGGTALAGSIGGPLGMGIGAGLGLLAGGLASLFGFGDNEDEYKEMMRRQEDVFAMQDRQSESTAKDADVKAEFYGRAANGKRPVWTPAGLVGKAATARVSNGEVVGNFEDGVVTRIPGEKNNKDTKLAALKDGDFVITNKYGLSDYAAATGDYAGALNLQEQIMGMRNSKGYKCGKLPKHANGIWDSIFSAIPHLTSFAGNLSQYNRAKEADTYAPDVYVDNPEGTKAVNTLAQLRFDADPYYREAQRGLNWANYDVRRNVGLGIGGRAIAQGMNYNNYLRGLADITKMKNEAQHSYAEKYANVLANLGATNQGRRMEAAAKRHAWMQQAQGQKESWMAQYRKNIDQNLLNAAADYMRWGQYNDSLGIQNKMLGLYQQQVNLDKEKYYNSLKSQNPTTITSTSYPFIITPEMQMREAMHYKNGKLPCHENGVNMGRKKNLSNDQVKKIVKSMPKEQGMSGYDPMANFIVPGIGLGKFINWYNSIPNGIPSRIQNMNQLIDNPNTTTNDPNIPTLMDFIRMGKTDPKGAWKAMRDLELSGLLGN